MKIAFFDCFAGCSGDMFLGALVDAGVPFEYLRNSLNKLNLHEYTISVAPCTRNGIRGTRVTVSLTDAHHHEHEPHEHKHAHRGIDSIFALLDQSSLSERVKQNTRTAFDRLAQVEAQIHGVRYQDVHFHEVGAVDAIVDITGAMICFEYLEIEKCYCSPLNVGSGFITCEHGTLPVPAPATAALLMGVPTYSRDVSTELVTPTGAAIVRTVCSNFGFMPRLAVKAIGYGAGAKEFKQIPNLLRIMIGESDSDQPSLETIMCIEATIDDMNPELYEDLSKSLFAAHALDVNFIPVTMKKSRPGIIVHVLAPIEYHLEIERVLLQESTTLGVRYHPVERWILPRVIKTVETKYGVIEVKEALLTDGTTRCLPEHDSCSRQAEAQQVSTFAVYQAAIEAIALRKNS